MPIASLALCLILLNGISIFAPFNGGLRLNWEKRYITVGPVATVIGLAMGPRNLIGRLYQAAPIGITVEGANILTRSMIIFGQGTIRCHPYILKEMRAVTDPDTTSGLVEFDLLLCDHVRFTLTNAARALFHGVTAGRLAKAPSGPVRRCFQLVTRLSAAFALNADIALLTLRGTLKRREKISGRLADILGHLYLICALLKRFEDREWPCDELPLVKWGCEESLAKIQESFGGLLHNLPSRPLAWLLRLLVFPLGRPFATERCPRPPGRKHSPGAVGGQRPPDCGTLSRRRIG